MPDSEVGEVVHLPRQCDNIQDNDARCTSRNAIWDEKFQGHLCFVHKAALDRARAKHPAGKHQGDI